jgi:hypothetical protein
MKRGWGCPPSSTLYLSPSFLTLVSCPLALSMAQGVAWAGSHGPDCMNSAKVPDPSSGPCARARPPRPKLVRRLQYTCLPGLASGGRALQDCPTPELACPLARQAWCPDEPPSKPGSSVLFVTAKLAWDHLARPHDPSCKQGGPCLAPLVRFEGTHRFW